MPGNNVPGRSVRRCSSTYRNYVVYWSGKLSASPSQLPSGIFPLHLRCLPHFPSIPEPIVRYGKQAHQIEFQWLLPPPVFGYGTSVHTCNFTGLNFNSLSYKRSVQKPLKNPPQKTVTTSGVYRTGLVLYLEPIQWHLLGDFLIRTLLSDPVSYLELARCDRSGKSMTKTSLGVPISFKLLRALDMKIRHRLSLPSIMANTNHECLVSQSHVSITVINSCLNSFKPL